MKYLVCRVGNTYEIQTIFDGEVWEEAYDTLSEDMCVIIRRDMEVVNTAGQFCGEYDTKGKARVQKDRLTQVLSIMDS